jgi:hypothetical protein
LLRCLEGILTAGSPPDSYLTCKKLLEDLTREQSHEESPARADPAERMADGKEWLINFRSAPDACPRSQPAENLRSWSTRGERGSPCRGCSVRMRFRRSS